MPAVRELMTPNPLTLRPSSTVLDALRMMNQVVIRHIPVVDGDRLVGLLSDRDLRNFELDNWLQDVTAQKVRHYLEQPVSHSMSKTIVSIGPDASMNEAIDLMLDHGISALPVCRDDRLVGIITTEDVLRAARDA